jgi:hypothetical protein
MGLVPVNCLKPLTDAIRDAGIHRSNGVSRLGVMKKSAIQHTQAQNTEQNGKIERRGHRLEQLSRQPDIARLVGDPMLPLIPACQGTRQRGV